MFKKKNREGIDTLIRPDQQGDKLLDAPLQTPENPLALGENAPAAKASIVGVWQLSRSEEIIYPGKKQYWLWMLRPILRPFDFTGRSPRMEYGLYWVFIIIIALLRAEVFEPLVNARLARITATPIVITILFPLVALSVRRLHDRGVSGWRFLLSIVSIFSIFQALADLFYQGEKGPNKFGRSPYSDDGDDSA